MNLNYFNFLVFLFLASCPEEVHAALLEEGEEALVVSDLLSSVQQRVLLLFGESVSALVVLNIVHDLVDTVLMAREQGAVTTGSRLVTSASMVASSKSKSSFIHPIDWSTQASSAYSCSTQPMISS